MKTNETNQKTFPKIRSSCYPEGMNSEQWEKFWASISREPVDKTIVVKHYNETIKHLK